MELNKDEVLVVAEAVSKAKESQLQELLEVQLALVGGGIGETVL